MSTIENLKVEDLGIAFADFEAEDFSSQMHFGPSKAVLRSYAGWEGCDNKLFQPYCSSDKVGKLADFVSAAIQAAKDKERELDKNDYQKKKDAEAAEKKKAEKKSLKKVVVEEEKEEQDLDDDDGFTTIEDNKIAKNKARGQWAGGRGGMQQRNQQQKKQVVPKGDKSYVQ